MKEKGCSVLGKVKAHAKWTEQDYFYEVIPEEIQTLAQKRVLAKQQKDFALADELRSKIEANGFVVLDRRDGYEIKRK